MQWLDDKLPAARLVCMYCGTADDFPHFQSFAYLDRQFSLYRCPSCGSLAYDPPEILVEIVQPFTDAYKANSRRGINYLLDAGYSPDYIALCGLSALGGLSGEALREHIFVDVGAGIGLSSYFIDAFQGIETLAIEPSYSGHLSREILGIDSQTAFFEDLPAEVMARLEARPCLLHLNSVIEHLRDPAAVIESLLGRIQIDILAAVVPDGATIDRNVPLGIQLPYLAPGDHLHLPTRAGMERLLRRLGFAHVTVREMGGLMIAVGGRAPIRLPDQQEVEAARDLLLHRLCGHPNPRVAGGAASRLLALASPRQETALVATLRARFAAEIDPRAMLARLRTEADVWEHVPFHLAATCYWMGYGAFQEQNYPEALAWLDVSEAAATRLARDLPPYSMQAMDYHWSARLHRAHILFVTGDHEGAENCLNAVIAAAADNVGGPRAVFVTAAEATRTAFRAHLQPGGG